MKKVYKEIDCNMDILKKEKIGVIGYGIQGRAQALNLRDSGYKPIIGNIADQYSKQAKDDGFKVLSIDLAVKESTILLILIPDESHQKIFDKYVNHNLNEGDLLIFAHGYSIRYNKINIPKKINVGLLAPRFPGEPIRKQYLNGKGVPAFLDVINDHSNNTLEKILSIGNAIGFSKAGMIPVTANEETEIDLFIEHFIGPLFISAVENSLKYLIQRGYSPIPAIIELYKSGERGSMWTAYAKKGLFKALNENASPTCKFGISSYYNNTFNSELKNQMKIVVDNIKNNSFAINLEAEESNNYKKTNSFFIDKSKSELTKLEDEVDKLINDYL